MRITLTVLALAASILWTGQSTPLHWAIAADILPAPAASADAKDNWRPPMTNDGWLDLMALLGPSEGSRLPGGQARNDTRDRGSKLVFFDPVKGDNATGEVYWWDGKRIVDSPGSGANAAGTAYGFNPLLPNEAAIKALKYPARDPRLQNSWGYPDWFLLRRGRRHDTFEIALSGGRSQAERMPLPGATMPQQWLPVDETGWTVLKPAADSHIVYVSSAGDDAMGQAYKADDPAIGRDVFLPVGPIRPFKTAEAAMERARPNMPDWVLLKRGDTWNDQSVKAQPGRSKTEPSVIGAFGPAAERPVLRGRGSRIIIGVSNTVTIGIDLHASCLDPDSPDYGRESTQAVDGGVRTGMSISPGTHSGIENVLVEDCLLRFAAVSFGGPTLMTNVVFRRNLVLDKYVPRGHTQGLWGSHASVLVEECAFDHDGWLYQDVPDNRGKPGRANMMSHDTYCTQMYSTIFRGNLFLRAASIGNKFTANYGPGSVKNVVLDDNLYVEGEIGISMGGNTSAPLRWVECKVLNNVMLDIGRGQPTGRNLGWGMGASDWDGGEIAGNLFLRQRSDTVRNVHGLTIGCGEECTAAGVHMRNVAIRNNVFHGLKNARMALGINEANRMKNVAIEGNLFQFADVPKPLIKTDSLGPELVFRGNVYDSAADAGQWFAVGETMLSFEQWVKESGEQGARKEKITFPDAERGIETYIASLGEAPTFDAFIAEVRKQSKMNWRKELSAPVINDWIREGFGVTKIPVDEERCEQTVAR